MIYAIRPLVLAMFSASFYVVQAQQSLNLEAIVPPAPNAAELAKYSTYPVGMLTGVPDISIPLYEVQSGDLRLPISISYHPSGVQVNQKSTDLGLGWSLIAGGTISRTIYGSPDEHTYGYFNYTPPSPATLAAVTNYYELQPYSVSPGYDMEPDLFAYNIGGKSGKFIFSQNQSFVTIPFAPIDISKNTNLAEFTIVDDNGDIYTFGSHSSSSSISSGNPGAERARKTTWYLTSIISADLTDTIEFSYESVATTEEITSVSYPIGMTLQSTNAAFTSGPENSSITTTTYDEKLLSRIDFKNGYVLFNRDTARNDASPINFCKELDEMVVYNSSNVLIKKLTFNQDYFKAAPFTNHWYDFRLKLTGMVESGGSIINARKHEFRYNEDDPLPRINSYNIDYWGYFNGASNTSLIPTTTVWGSEIAHPGIGVTESWIVGSAIREPSATHMKAGTLKTIIYPTGGHTDFEFEPHKYLSAEYVTQSVSRGGTTYGLGRFIKSEDTYASSYPSNSSYIVMNSSSVVATMSITFSPIHPDPEYQESQAIALVNDANGTILKQWTHTGDVTQPMVINEKIVIPQGSYTLKSTVYGPTSVYSTCSLSWTENTDQHPIKIGGGLRVTSIKNYTDTNTLANEVTYAYGVSENGLGEKLFNERKFYRNYEDVWSRYFDMGTNTCRFIEELRIRNYLGISRYNSLNYLGSPVLYSSVTKYEGSPSENLGKTISSFVINMDFVEYPDYFLNSGNYGSINHAWHGGQLENEIILDKTGYPLETTAYEYDNYNMLTEWAVVVKQHKQFVKIEDCPTDPSGPEPGMSFGQGYYKMFSYPIKTGLNLMTKATRIVEPENPEPLTEVKTLQYQNPLNRYLTESSMSTSDQGATTIRRIKYPQDMTDATSIAMTSRNILSPVLEEKILKSVNGLETLVSTTSTTYMQTGSIIKPDVIKASTGNDPLESRIQFNSYDTSGNITEQQKTNDLKEAYIWGYKGEYPVAKIIGKAYNECLTQSGINLTIIDDPATSDASMRLELSKLYQLTGCMVTTYTYKQGVGVTSETDSNQRTTYYEYDDLARLHAIKDNDGNIVKKIDYSYKE